MKKLIETLIPPELKAQIESSSMMEATLKSLLSSFEQVVALIELSVPKIERRKLIDLSKQTIEISLNNFFNTKESE